MYRYLVTDTNPAIRAVALTDPAGRRYVALTEDQVPAIGAELRGDLPGPGLRVLHGRFGHEFRLHFELLRCSQDATLDRLHADAPAVLPAQPARNDFAPLPRLLDPSD
jgi:hypothetical protein